MTPRGHSRSILAPTETLYVISYWSSIVAFVLSCPRFRDIALTKDTYNEDEFVVVIKETTESYGSWSRL